MEKYKYAKENLVVGYIWRKDYMTLMDLLKSGWGFIGVNNPAK